MAGTPGACSQVFCHRISCIVTVHRQRFPMHTQVRTTTTTTHTHTHTPRDLGDSLRCRTSIPVHLFYLVVEGRVVDDDELARSLGRDRVVSMRGRVLGGSRNVSPIPGEWTCPGCLRSGCWPTKNTCFRCGTARPNSPLPLDRC